MIPSTPNTLPMDWLLPWGRALLVGSFGIALIQTLREEEDLGSALEGLALGLLALTFYSPLAAGLLKLSQELLKMLDGLGGEQNLNQLILALLKKAATEPVDGETPTLNIPNALAQVWTLGVWGVMSTLVQAVFLLVQHLLEVAQAVLWKLLLFLFPIGAGLVPVFPRLLRNQMLYAIELALWLPLLRIVQLVTSDVARKHIGRTDDWGGYVVAIELVAIVLILSVPALCHRALSGAFEGDIGTSLGGLSLAKRFAARVRG